MGIAFGAATQGVPIAAMRYVPSALWLSSFRDEIDRIVVGDMSERIKRTVALLALNHSCAPQASAAPTNCSRAPAIAEAARARTVDRCRALDELDLSLPNPPHLADGDDRTGTGVEALDRWNRAALGAIPPATIAPLGERFGRLGEIMDLAPMDAI